jgi:hypothetical protein
MIRLVIQLVDTPGNRVAMDAIHGYAKKKKVQGPHGALKREDVQVIELQTTRPPKSQENVNVDLPDTAAQDSTSKSNNPAVSG